MVEKNDWRLRGQEKYLFEVMLELKKYKPYRQGWEHDHCEFCWAEFATDDRPDVLQEGYATQNAYHWICKQCYEDFNEQFHWKAG